MSTVPVSASSTACALPAAVVAASYAARVVASSVSIQAPCRAARRDGPEWVASQSCVCPGRAGEPETKKPRAFRTHLGHAALFTPVFAFRQDGLQRAFARPQFGACTPCARA